jgi:hypothetical protein
LPENGALFITNLLPCKNDTIQDYRAYWFHNAMPKKTSIISPISFVDRLIKKNELGQPFYAYGPPAKSYALPSPSIRMAGCRGTRSCIHTSEKSGKTTLNGVLTLWWAAVAAVRLPASSAIAYSGIVDPSGGRHDAFTVAMDTVKEMALSWMR